MKSLDSGLWGLGKGVRTEYPGVQLYLQQQEIPKVKVHREKNGMANIKTDL